MNRHNIVPFGTTPAGETVHKIHLQNQDLSCDILTYGATLQSLVVPDRDGQRVDVLLGYDTLEQYLQGGCYFGATVGRVANRIAGGQFELNNVSYNLPLNDGNNHHHGGPDGFAFRVWKISAVSDTSVTLSLHSPDGDQGYPGNIDVEAEFTLQDSTLVLRHRAVSDADTLCSLTRHGFCLETQFYPDAIHHESFPSPILEAGKVYNHSTVFSFNNI